MIIGGNEKSVLNLKTTEGLQFATGLIKDISYVPTTTNPECPSGI